MSLKDYDLKRVIASKESVDRKFVQSPEYERAFNRLLAHGEGVCFYCRGPADSAQTLVVDNPKRWGGPPGIVWVLMREVCGSCSPPESLESIVRFLGEGQVVRNAARLGFVCIDVCRPPEE